MNNLLGELTQRRDAEGGALRARATEPCFYLGESAKGFLAEFGIVPEEFKSGHGILFVGAESLNQD
jgi:hypothetical protein